MLPPWIIDRIKRQKEAEEAKDQRPALRIPEPQPDRTPEEVPQGSENVDHVLRF